MSSIENSSSRISIEQPLVAQLITEQFPELSTLPISKLNSTGTENAVYRLGECALIRLPTTDGAAKQVDKEQLWLPKFAKADLPLAIPRLLAAGTSSDNYPYPWSIYKWLKGKPATTERITDIRHAAELLGHFVLKLQAIESTDGPPPGEHNFFRGVALAERDDMMQDSLKRLHAEGFDTTAISRVWDDAVTAPPWNASSVWIHGDLADSNMLAKKRNYSGHRELSAVIDFGGTAVGDPACDLLVGWDVLARERDTFFNTIQPDDATILRGRGWALSTAAISLVRFPDKPAITTCALRKINEAATKAA